MLLLLRRAILLLTAAALFTGAAKNYVRAYHAEAYATYLERHATGVQQIGELDDDLDARYAQQVLARSMVTHPERAADPDAARKTLEADVRRTAADRADALDRLAVGLTILAIVATFGVFVLWGKWPREAPVRDRDMESMLDAMAMQSHLLPHAEPPNASEP